MPAFLDEIVARTRVRVAAAKPAADLHELERRAARHAPRGFRRALELKSQNGVAVIAELKKASPSKGLIREEFDAAGLARELEAAGAAALSVLTDEEFFQGSVENLRQASSATQLPCLRKDFIVDEFQLLEARVNCADAVLLIVAALEQAELVTLVRVAESGIRSGSDIAQLRALGYQAFLVGESLMRAQRPGDALRELLQAVPSDEYRVRSAR